MYQCKCGREFARSQSYNAHLGHCRVHMGDRGIPDKFGDKRAWSRGRSKSDPNYGNSIARCAEATSKRLKAMGDENPLLIFSRTQRHPGDSTAAKQSETRSRMIKEGTLELPFNHKNMISYLDYPDGKSRILRSSYEFIYAIHLINQNLQFTVEEVRVEVIDPEKAGQRTFICDFCVEGLEIHEIKGFPNESKLRQQREAFESAGYKFKVVYGDEVWKIYHELISAGYPMEDYLAKIKSGKESRNYFHYKL